MTKKRILFINEMSEVVQTGFSVIGKEVLQRLYDTGKYLLFEFGSYGKTNDPKSTQVPWPVFGAMPHESDSFGQQRYNSSMQGQFGSALFEQVCIEVRPDIIIDIRDYWMVSWQLRSPYRKNYKIIWMPTLDGRPQRLPWLQDYAKADRLLAYSEFGKKTLNEEAPDIKVWGVVNPGVNEKIYYPMDKKMLREREGINPNANILLSVMRNQKRKLFPDLIEIFAKFIRYCANNNREDLARNTYLYLHTSFPDVGFSIDRLIMESGVGHLIYTTYMCEACKQSYSDFFQGEITVCKHCNNLAAHMPNTANGVSRERLAEIYNIASAYCQISIAEGFCVPLAEAKATGLPCFAIEYSAQAEQVNAPNCGCFPLKVGKFFHESCIETEQIRCLPDEKDTIEKLYKFFCLSKQEQARLGELARQDVLSKCTFDRAAKIFEETIDGLDVPDHSETWDNPVGNFAPMDTSNIPQNGNMQDLIDYCLTRIVNKPELIGSSYASDLLKYLNTGAKPGELNAAVREPFDPNRLINMFLGMGREWNFWENARLEKLNQGNSVEKVRWELA